MECAARAPARRRPSASLPQATKKTIRPVKTATTTISQIARNVAPISPSSAISARHASDAESMYFESSRVIDRKFCGERDVPSPHRETYFSIRISRFAYSGHSANTTVEGSHGTQNGSR